MKGTHQDRRPKEPISPVKTSACHREHDRPPQGELPHAPQASQGLQSIITLLKTAATESPSPPNHFPVFYFSLRHLSHPNIPCGIVFVAGVYFLTLISWGQVPSKWSLGLCYSQLAHTPGHRRLNEQTLGGRKNKQMDEHSNSQVTHTVDQTKVVGLTSHARTDGNTVLSTYFYSTYTRHLHKQHSSSQRKKGNSYTFSKTKVQLVKMTME